MSMCILTAPARTKSVAWLFPDLGRGIFPVILAYNCSCEMSRCILIAQARAKSAPRGSQALGLRHFPVNYRIKGSLVEILLDSFLRGSCMLYRSLTEDLVDILVGSSLRGICMRSLQMPCLRGACMCLYESSCEKFLGGSCVKIM